MSIVKTEWKILCSSHKACPKVIEEMEKMYFTKIKDTPNSPTSDISAILVLENDKKIEETASTLFKKCGADIQRISIATV
ncbi:MAG: hypothetical protein E6L00_07610 [Thaumarchaeota archaeon]|nr:MAG: hypothetical protein E6L00_07610 [Nitrososphaerota archaeon]